MSGSGFLEIAAAEPFPGQLMRALEALASYLQRGHTWSASSDRLAELEARAEASTKEALTRNDHEAASLALMALLRDEGFGGAGPAYERVENSFIDRVLQTGHGLPITLSALAIHLAETSGFPLHGIGFPGHFIVGVGLNGPAPMVFDPFGGGEALSFGTLAELYTRATGRHLTPSAPMLRDALQAASTRSILVRVCNNLHHHYLQRGSHDRAADVVDLLAVLHPRGVALRKLATKLERRVRTLN